MARLVYASSVAAAGILVLFTASRLSLIGFAIELLVLVFIVDRRWYVMLLGLVGVAVGFYWWSNVFLSSDIRLASKFNAALSDMEDSSIEGRFSLTLNGLWMVYDTAGRGVGAAGFRRALMDRDVPFPDENPLPGGRFPHNLWVQVASEYGILPAIGFLSLLVFIGRLALQANRKRPGAPQEVRILGIVTLVGLVGYLFCGVVIGSAIRHAVHWMFFATLVVMGARLYQARAAYHAARLRGPQGQLTGAKALAARRRSGSIGREATAALHRASP